MNIAFVLFNRMTSLDFVGVYDAVTRLKKLKPELALRWEFCAVTDDIVDDRGLRLVPSRVGSSLAAYDLLIVPGGHGTRALQHDEAFCDWLRTAAPVELKASVCTGSILMGAAGFLKGLRATTHPTAYDELAPYCAQVVEERIVDEGDVITSRGVTAGIDLGLHLVVRLADEDARDHVADRMDYPYRWEGAVS